MPQSRCRRPEASSPTRGRSAGSIPDGLTLGNDGTVSGTPTSAGNFAFTIQVADSGGSTATVSGKIGIAAALSASIIPACARACQVEAGCVNVCGNFGAISGGVGPYHVTATGYIPPGTTISPNQLAYTGTFSRPVSYWQSTVTVTDAFGQTASVSPIFNVFAHISLTGGRCGYVQLPCTVTLSYSGGTPGGSPTLRVSGWAGDNTCGFAAPVICPQPRSRGLQAVAVFTSPLSRCRRTTHIPVPAEPTRCISPTRACAPRGCTAHLPARR